MRNLLMPKEPSRVQPRSVEDLNAELQSEWDKTIRTWGIPNHLYATMCCQPQLGLTEVDYANSFIFDEGGFTTLPLPGDRKRRVLFPTAGFVDRVTKELALSIVSLLNRSRYSITHHSLIATGTLNELVDGSTPAKKKARAEAMLLHLVDADGHVDFENQLHDGKPLYSDLQLATLRFAVKLNSDPHSLTDDDFAALKKVQREEAIRQIEVHRLDAQFRGKVPELYIGAYVDAMLVELTWCLCHFSGLLNRWFIALRVRDEQERVNGTPSFVDSYNAAVPESVKQRNNQLLGERGWGQHSSAHTPFALEKYDSRRNGPLLGVSDEGSAAATIVDAAYRSAKALASSSPCAAVVGMIVDGERMTSAGEVPIGPDEYAQIMPAVTGRTFCSTNVGTRVSTRLHQPLPEFAVKAAHGKQQQWIDEIFKRFEPFIKTPDGEPRPLTVRLIVESDACKSALRTLVPKLEAGRRQKKLGPKDKHRLSLLWVYSHEIADDLQPIRDLIRLAAELMVPEVVVDGPLREAARRRLSVQGMLNVLTPASANALLAEAAKAKVRLAYRFEDDPESASRVVWTGICAARSNGLNAAKYGLTPLVFEQQREIVERIQRWTKGWTAVPAFYVDTPLMTADQVYEPKECVAAARRWMAMVSKAGAKVVLVDAPDRIVPRRLLKANAQDSVGVLTPKQVGQLNRYAESLKLRVLWSGGIHAEQAFELASFGVFGIFTTGSTAKPIPVSGELAGDAAMAASAEPTSQGVRRIHALVQAGFLSTAIKDKALVRSIRKAADAVLKDDLNSKKLERHLAALNKVLEAGWKKHWQ